MRTARSWPACAAALAVVLAATWPAPALEATWSVTLSAGVEWAQAAEHDGCAALLVATSDGHLLALDGETGQSQRSDSIRVGRGVRPAAPLAAAGAAYAFDRHAVYALDLARPGQLLWKAGAEPADPDRYPDDPEHLTGLIAAAAVPAGVLTVDSSGRLALLSRTDGRPLLQTDLGPVRVCRLHASTRAGIVLWSREATTHAAFVELPCAAPAAAKPAAQTAPPSLVRRELGGPWPIWSDVVDEELVTLAGGTVTCWTADGSPRPFALLESAVGAAGLGVFAPPPTLVVVGSGEARGYRLADGRCVWNHAEGSRRMDGGALRSSGSHACAVWRDCVVVRDVSSGREEARAAWQNSEHFAACHVAGGYLLVVVAISADPQRESASTARRGAGTAESRVCLLRVPLAGPRPADAPARSSAGRRFILDATGAPRDVIWIGDFVVVREQNGLRAYRLP